MRRFMKSVLACVLVFVMVLTVMPVKTYVANKKAAKVFVESGKNNDINVSEKVADTKLSIKASGKVENVQIDAKSDVAVSGTTTDPIK